jgi:hypothetical protein
VIVGYLIAASEAAFQYCSREDPGIDVLIALLVGGSVWITSYEVACLSALSEDRIIFRISSTSRSPSVEPPSSSLEPPGSSTNFTIFRALSSVSGDTDGHFALFD